MLSVVRLESVRQWSLMHSFWHDSKHSWDRFRPHTQIQIQKPWKIHCFCRTKKSTRFRETFFTRNGGASAARLRGPLGPPPISCKKTFLEIWLPFSLYKAMNVSWILNLKLCVTSESVSRIFWIVSKWMHERSLTHWFRRTTLSILWHVSDALFRAF